MIFCKDVKNLRIYKRQMFLPTLEDSDTPNKKTKSAIFLLTPNRKSSINLMNHPLLEEMEEGYHYLNDNESVVTEDTGFKTSIVYSGWNNDVEAVKKAISDEEFKDILNKVGYKRTVILHLEVGNFPGIDEYFDFRIRDEIEPVDCQPYTYLKIHVPRHNLGTTEEYYKVWIMNFICKAIYIMARPDQVSTQAPKIFADTYTDADTMYNGADIESAKYNNVYENSPITIENLGKKFKYADKLNIPCKQTIYK